MEYKGEKYENIPFEVDGEKFTAKPCMKSAYGEWNEDKSACKHLLAQIGQRDCGRYEWIKANVPNWEFYPAFGAGCCMALFNAARENIIRKIKELTP